MASNFAACTTCNLFPLGLTLLFLVALVSSTSVQPAPLLARSGKVLQVLVPVKPDFKEFVECSNDSSLVKGFCIDVFKSALGILIPKASWTDVNYTCFDIGDDSYDTMVNVLSNKSYPYDAVVGDTTISAARLEKANFTQSYLDSGIVIVTPAEDVSQNFPGVFFVPFTIHTWLVMIASIALTGLALWLLECNGNPYLQRAESKPEQLKKVFWFVTSILVFFKRESITNPLAKFVMIAWILFILLLGSSYTASLSSILTVNELSSVSLSITDLHDRNLSVGYQTGSIVYDYLTLRHDIKKERLVELNNTDEYADALRSKKVDAVVDEIPYISLFLAAQSASNCKFAVSSKLTIEGFGFLQLARLLFCAFFDNYSSSNLMATLQAFLDKTLSAAFSVAILNLSESGQMQKLQDGWKLSNFQCPSRVVSTQLDLKSSEGLFILLGSAMFVCMVIFVLKHVVIPCWVRSCVRMRANQRQDAVGNFLEPNFHASIRRWISARHLMLPEDFA